MVSDKLHTSVLMKVKVKKRLFDNSFSGNYGSKSLFFGSVELLPV